MNGKMKANRIVDLSQPIIGGYSNPAFMESELSPCLSYEKDGWMGEVLKSATHVGTHIDAPAHKLKEGSTIDKYPLHRFQGNAVPIDLCHKKNGVCAEICVSKFRL